MTVQPIVVAGLAITRERFPHLYAIAARNPVELEALLRSLLVASGGSQEDILSVAINLESDLAHG